MAGYFTRRTREVLSFAAIAGLCVATAATAQGPGDPAQGGGNPPGAGPGGGPGGPGGGPGGPGFGRRGGGRRGAPSITNVPSAALAKTLKLTDDQASKITKIQAKLMADRKALMPAPGDQNGPPDQQTMQDTMQQIGTLEQQAKTDIMAVLTDDQKQALPGALKQIGTLGMAGIPPETLGDLNLTADQVSAIIAIAQQAQTALQPQLDAARQSGDFQAVRDAMQQSRQQSHAKVLALLTDAQKDVLSKFKPTRPQGGPGGFGPPPGGFGPPPGGPPPQDGGFGPPPQDGGGGPPPQDGGGGPPPPQDGGGPPDGGGGPPPQDGGGPPDGGGGPPPPGQQ